MKKFITNAYVKGSNALYSAKEGFKRFLKEEKGGSEIIAVIILVAIVVILALFFKEQLGNLVESIWGGITGKTEGITQEFGSGEVHG